jgi:hypothetical protein
MDRVQTPLILSVIKYCIGQNINLFSTTDGIKQKDFYTYPLIITNFKTEIKCPYIQSDSKLLSGFPFIGHGSPDDNLELPRIYIFNRHIFSLPQESG